LRKEKGGAIFKKEEWNNQEQTLEKEKERGGNHGGNAQNAQKDHDLDA